MFYVKLVLYNVKLYIHLNVNVHMRSMRLRERINCFGELEYIFDQKQTFFSKKKNGFV